MTQVRIVLTVVESWAKDLRQDTLDIHLALKHLIIQEMVTAMMVDPTQSTIFVPLAEIVMTVVYAL